MGNTEVLKRGDIQLTSAGTGISHSEKAHGEKQVHFLQIWSVPSAKRLEPKYFTRYVTLVFPLSTDRYSFRMFASDISLTKKRKINSFKWWHPPTPQPYPSRAKVRALHPYTPVTLSAALISPSSTIPHTFATTKGIIKGYIHVIQTSGYNPGKSEGATVRIKGIKWY
jgi:hypothetical protein